MIGRRKEKEYLRSLLNEEEPQFVAVFGRRRVGKTYLIRESFEHDFLFSHTGVSNSSIKPSERKREQLNEFAKSLNAAGYESVRPDSWSEAFDCLKTPYTHGAEWLSRECVWNTSCR